MEATNAVSSEMANKRDLCTRVFVGRFPMNPTEAHYWTGYSICVASIVRLQFVAHHLHPTQQEEDDLTCEPFIPFELHMHKPSLTILR